MSDKRLAVLEARYRLQARMACRGTSQKIDGRRGPYFQTRLQTREEGSQHDFFDYWNLATRLLLRPLLLPEPLPKGSRQFFLNLVNPPCQKAFGR